MCIYIHIHTVTWYHGSTGTYANSIPLGNPITFVGRIPFLYYFFRFPVKPVHSRRVHNRVYIHHDIIFCRFSVKPVHSRRVYNRIYTEYYYVKYYRIYV